MSNARQLAANLPREGGLSNRNLIINGAMQVAQRGTSAANITTTGYYACDRAGVYFSSTNELTTTVSQDTDAPDGFDKSYKVLVTTAEATVATTDLHCMLWYKIEGQDLQQLGYGTSSAKPLTISFWVKSNVTGTYTLSAYGPIGGTNTVAAPTYTIDVADTWEYKTITISGSTIGNLVNTNALGLHLYWNGLVGSDYTSGTQATSWVTYTTNNWAVGHTADFGSDVNDYWQITGVQLEVGDTATPFEHRSYSDQLQACQRYYEKSGTLYLTHYSGSSSQIVSYPYRVIKRATPTSSIVGGNAGTVTGTGNIYSNYLYNSASQSANSAELIADAEL